MINTYVGIKVLETVSSNPHLWADTLGPEENYQYLEKYLEKYFDISTWKSHNSALEKGTCNATDTYMIHIQQTLVITPTSKITTLWLNWF